MFFIYMFHLRKQFFLSTILLLLSVFCFSQNREITTLSDGWKFQKGEIQQPVEFNYDDANWESVSIPHDWAIKGPFILDGNGSTGKLPWKGPCLLYTSPSPRDA